MEPEIVLLSDTASAVSFLMTSSIRRNLMHRIHITTMFVDIWSFEAGIAM
jgi:hypothetical protein